MKKDLESAGTADERYREIYHGAPTPVTIPSFERVISVTLLTLPGVEVGTTRQLHAYDEY